METQEKHKLHPVIHILRFQLLGKTQIEIAECFLGITNRYWNQIKAGERGVTEKFLEKASVIAKTQRISQLPMTFSDLADTLKFFLINAKDHDTIREIDRRLTNYVVKYPQDAGLHGLYGATQMHMWHLALSPYDRRFMHFLVNAEKHWTKAANLATKPANHVFRINALTARIYRETFYQHNGDHKPSQENYEKYHKFAEDLGWISAWRDALEQAALLRKDNLIDNNFAQLLNAVNLQDIRIEDQLDVLLPELMQIDGKDALINRPCFQEWVEKITLKKVA